MLRPQAWKGGRGHATFPRNPPVASNPTQGEEAMKRLYKFMRYFPGYFTSPTLRATQLSALNDPFECLLSEGALVDLSERIDRTAAEEDRSAGSATYRSPEQRFNPHFAASKIAHQIRKENLIVSLTANIDSITMWSHYAEQHKGIVLCLDTDLLGIDNQERHTLHAETKKNLPLPVLYSHKRFRRKEDRDGNDAYDWLYEKSDEWAYEKEGTTEFSVG